MHPLLGLFCGCFGRLQRLLEHRQRCLTLLERIALAGKLVAEFADLGFQPDQFAQIRYFQAVALFLQSGATRSELLQQLVGMTFARIFQTQLLFRLRQDILCLRKQRLCGTVMVIGHGKAITSLTQRRLERGKLFGGFGQCPGIVATCSLKRLLAVMLLRLLRAHGI